MTSYADPSFRTRADAGLREALAGARHQLDHLVSVRASQHFAWPGDLPRRPETLHVIQVGGLLDQQSLRDALAELAEPDLHDRVSESAMDDREP